jgi:hypothetical protein
VEVTRVRRIERRQHLRILAAVVIAGVAAIGTIWWGVTSQSGDQSVRVTATIDLRGAPCRSHSTECTTLVNGGAVVIYGPDAPNQTSSPEHRVRLSGYTTPMSISLAAGRYHLAFVVNPPYSVLLPNFGGDGSFDVGQTPVHLGVVRPSTTWQVEGD